MLNRLSVYDPSIAASMNLPIIYQNLLSLESEHDRFAYLNEVVESYVRTSLSKQLATANSRFLYPLPADHLLTMIYYGVYRAFVSNIQIMGFECVAMCEDECPSPFPASTDREISLMNLPPCLQPTTLQRTIPHHAMWDVFPDPVIRDNALRLGEDNIDDEALMVHVWGAETASTDVPKDSQERTGLIVWGEPWELNSWEITESFARAWGWFLRGAVDLQRGTNRWRASRDEQPLYFAE